MQHQSTRIALLLAACTAGTAYAANIPKLTPWEVDQARLYLKQTRDYVIGATKGLSEAPWQFKPSPSRWSIAEIVEHMVLTQDFVLGPLAIQVHNAGIHDEYNSHDHASPVVQSPGSVLTTT